MKMELTKNRGDLERERDTLKVECDGLQNNINVMENTVEHLNTVITEKVNQYIIYIYIYIYDNIWHLPKLTATASVAQSVEHWSRDPGLRVQFPAEV